MTPGIELTREERAIAERYVARLEKSARNWARRRVFTVLIVFAVACSSAWCTYDFFRAVDAEPVASEHFEKIALPADAPPELWIVAELRRCVAMLELINGVQMITMMEGVWAFLVGCFAIVGAVHVVMHWNDGLVHGVFAKALRWQLAQQDDASAS